MPTNAEELREEFLKALYPFREEARPDVAAAFDCLRAGADLRYNGHDNISPLSAAACKGSPGLVAAVLDTGVPVDERLKNGYTALLMACREGKSDTLQVLIDRGADVDAVKDNDWDGARLATFNGHDHIVPVLERGRIAAEQRRADAERQRAAEAFQQEIGVAHIAQHPVTVRHALKFSRRPLS